MEFLGENGDFLPDLLVGVDGVRDRVRTTTQARWRESMIDATATNNGSENVTNAKRSRH